MKVNFELVQLWYNDCYQPYTLVPTREDSAKVYAILVEGEYFLLGQQGQSLHICDLENEVNRQ